MAFEKGLILIEQTIKHLILLEVNISIFQMLSVPSNIALQYSEYKSIQIHATFKIILE